MSVAQEQTILDKIRTRGYWRVVVRPVFFERNHMPNYSELFPIIAKNSVQRRGWGYPHVDQRNPPFARATGSVRRPIGIVLLKSGDCT